MDSDSFEPHQFPDRSANLRHWVRSEIWRRIGDGRLRPGQHLFEREIADGLSVSRVPVREALRLLEAEGYVRAAPGGGVVVRELSIEEVEEMFDVRGALEALATRLAARRASTAQLKRLEDVLARCRTAIDEDRRADVGRLNSEFHERLRQAGRNRFVTERIEPLIGRLMWAFQESPDPERVWRGHRALLDAIRAGDQDRAVRHAHDDVEHNRKIALDLLRQEPPPTW